MGIKLTIVSRLIVRNSNPKKLTTFSNNKMVCNKITFVFVLVGLISISCMVSSAAVGDLPISDPRASAAASSEATTAAATSTPKATTAEATTQKVDPSATTQKVDPSATTQKVDPSATTTQQENGAGCPKITYG